MPAQGDHRLGPLFFYQSFGFGKRRAANDDDEIISITEIVIRKSLILGELLGRKSVLNQSLESRVLGMSLAQHFTIFKLVSCCFPSNHAGKDNISRPHPFLHYYNLQLRNRNIKLSIDILFKKNRNGNRIRTLPLN